MGQDQDREVFFFDESRFGTHSRAGHGWFKTGNRTPIKRKLGFKNFYLYTAASPKTGDNFSLMIPNIDTLCMNVYLQEFSAWLGEKKVFLVIDGAGWHKATNLLIPHNIKIIYLPPYSLELNPIERLWQHIKDNVLKNYIYDNLDILEKSLFAFLNSITNADIQSICNVSYMSYYF